MIENLNHREELKKVWHELTEQLESVLLQEEDPTKMIHIGTMLLASLWAPLL